jgi:heme oxygenase
MELKEATSELHSKAEKMEFNQRMFRGELPVEQYVRYLQQQHSIFKTIEQSFTLPHPDLTRNVKIFEDLTELGTPITFSTPSTLEYNSYLSTLSNNTILPHIYLNYLALAFGGQMMKSKIHGSGRMYDFDNMMDAVGSIRAVQSDDWADEVNKGFQFIINILDELQNTTGSNS